MAELNLGRVVGYDGQNGQNGERGSKWFNGISITGTITTPTVFINSGITDAMVNDMYFNNDNGNIYYCTTGGNSNTAKWVYSMCLGSLNQPIDLYTASWSEYCTTPSFTSIASLNNIMLGASDGGEIYYSENDGKDWHGTGAMFSSGGSQLSGRGSFTYSPFGRNGGTYVAVDTRGAVFKSNDGKIWNNAYYENQVSNCFNYIYFSDNFNKLFALSERNLFYFNDDLTSYSTINSPNEDIHTKGVCGNGVDIIIGYRRLSSSEKAGYAGIISPTGDKIQLSDLSGSSYTGITFNDIIFEKNKFIIVGSNGNIYISSNGTSWDTYHIHSKSLSKICYDKNCDIFIAVDAEREILYSHDLITWSTSNKEITNDIPISDSTSMEFFTLSHNNLGMILTGNSLQYLVKNSYQISIDDLLRLLYFDYLSRQTP